MTNQLPLDPAPEEWLSPTRLGNLRSELGDSVTLLSSAGVLLDVLRFWISRELGDTEVDSSSSISWARNQWGHRLDNLFLQRKDCLDEASCRLLRVKNQGLALELYHRLQAKEATFEEISIKYGVGPEKFYGGLLKRQTLVSFPGNLGRFLRKLEPSELTKPFQVGKQFFIIELISYESAVYDETTKQKLLELELQRWLDGMTAYISNLVH